MGFFDNIDIFDNNNEIIENITENRETAPIMIPELNNDMDGFNGQDVVVFGKPYEVGEILDHQQGDNPFDAGGNCNLVSTANFMNLCGIPEANETDITGYAILNGECDYNYYAPPWDRGGSGTQNMQNILSDFGISTEVVTPYDNGGNLESIAVRLEEGYVGAMGVNCGYLWNDPCNIGDGRVNHEVTLTGTVRDTNGELLALTVCDSGTGEACHVVPIEQLRDCYENVPGADVVFTTEPMRMI